LIKIKKLLFELLDKIEPNELLELRISRQYNTVYLANKESILPLATEMRYQPEEENSLEEAYRQAFLEGAIGDRECKYIADHVVILNEKRYVIIEELIDFQLLDDYFTVTISNPEGTFTDYYKYSDIMSIRIKHEENNYIVKEYNTLNYKYKTNRK
jgi:hypothetical protein